MASVDYVDARLLVRWESTEAFLFGCLASVDWILLSRLSPCREDEDASENQYSEQRHPDVHLSLSLTSHSARPLD